MYKSIISIVLGVLLFATSTYAQESYAPRQGQFQATLVLGNSPFNDGVVDLTAPSAIRTDVVPPDINAENSVSYILQFSGTNNLVNIVGAELKYFVTDQIAVSFLGAGVYSLTPGKDFEPGVPASGIPNNGSFDARYNTRLVGSLGADYYFPTSLERVQPYAGARFTMQYASITAEAMMDANTALGGTPTIDYGQRTGQILGWSPALVAGIDYVVAPGMLIGLEIVPVSYYHSKVSLYAAHGLTPATGVAKEWLFLSQPKLKIGFRF